MLSAKRDRNTAAPGDDASVCFRVWRGKDGKEQQGRRHGLLSAGAEDLRRDRKHAAGAATRDPTPHHGKKRALGSKADGKCRVTRKAAEMLRKETLKAYG